MAQVYNCPHVTVLLQLPLNEGAVQERETFLQLRCCRCKVILSACGHFAPYGCLHPEYATTEALGSLQAGLTSLEPFSRISSRPRDSVQPVPQTEHLAASAPQRRSMSLSKRAAAFAARARAKTAWKHVDICYVTGRFTITWGYPYLQRRHTPKRPGFPPELNRDYCRSWSDTYFKFHHHPKTHIHRNPLKDVFSRKFFRQLEKTYRAPLPPRLSLGSFSVPLPLFAVFLRPHQAFFEIKLDRLRWLWRSPRREALGLPANGQANLRRKC